MKHLLISIAVSMLTIAGCAQTIPLQGVIVVQNSAYEHGTREYLSGVSLRALMAKSAASDGNGQFTLAFTGVGSGTPVRLAVAKPEYEVVNGRDLEQVIVGRQTPVQVVMASSAKLAEAQMQYYQIAINGINTGYDHQMKALRDERTAMKERLAAVSKKYENEVGSLYEAIELLTRERIELAERAQGLAVEFAAVNLDDASALYRTAFELFKAGKLDSALIVLDEGLLDNEYTAAVEQKKTASERIRQVYSSYGLKADILQGLGSFRDVVPVYRAMRRLQLENPEIFSHKELGVLSLEVATNEFRLGRYDTARYVLQRSVDMLVGKDNAALKAQSLGILANCSVAKDDLERAFTELGSAEELLDTILPHLEARAFLDACKGSAFEKAYKLDSALFYYARAYNWTSANRPAGDMDVLGMMNNMASIHFKTGNIDAALTGYREVLARLEDRGPGLDHRAGTVHLNIGNCLLKKRDRDNAERAFRQALAIRRATLGADHPDLAMVYRSLAWLCFGRQEFERSVAYADSGLHILSALSSGAIAEKGELLEIKGVALQALGRNQEAQECISQALSNIKELLGPDHPEFHMCKMSLARIRAEVHDYHGAEILVGEAITGLAATIGMDHPTTITFRTNQLIFLTELEEYGRVDPLCPELINAFRSALGPDSVGLGLLHGMWGEAKFHLSQWSASDSLLLESYRLHPSGDASWYLYKLAEAQKDDAKALNWLSQCVTLRRGSKGTSQEELHEAESALKALATRLGRKDVLEQFGLE